MWIEFGIINYKLIIPFIYPFLSQLSDYIHKDDIKPFYEIFIGYVAYLVSGLVYLIIRCRMKKIVKENDSNEMDEKKTISVSELKEIIDIKDRNTNLYNRISIGKKKINSRFKRKKYLFLLLITITYLIPSILDISLNESEQSSYISSNPLSLLIYMIFYVVLSRFILGYKFYKHHFFSLCIILVCNIIIVILLLIGEDNSHIASKIIALVFITFLYALSSVLEKKYFNICRGSPYHLMFVVGLISLIFLLLYETITVLAFSKDEKYNGIFYQMELNFENNKLYPLIFIGDVVVYFLWLAAIILTIYFFTPCHFLISESLLELLVILFNNTLKSYSVGIQIIIYILFFISIFSALIYNEIIIINLWSLNVNTKKYISKRQEYDTELILNSQIENIEKTDVFEDTSDL